MKKDLMPRLGFMLSMAIFGTMAPFVRAIGVSSGELALYRAVLAFVLIGAVLLVTGQKLPLQQIKKSLLLLLLSGAALGLNWMLLFEAYKYTTVSVATLSYYFAPVLVTILCPVLFKEKMKPINWLCFVFSTIGLVLLTGIGDLSKGQNHFIGVAFGLCAAVFYAAVMLLNKRIKDVTGLHRTVLQFLAAALVLIPYVALTGGTRLYTLTPTGWGCLLTVGILHTALAYCLYFSGLKALPGQKAAILSYIDPLMAVVISVTVLHEAITLPQLIGGVLILGFTLFNELKS